MPRGQGAPMANKLVWTVTWSPVVNRVTGRRPMAWSLKQKDFDDLRSAVDFVTAMDPSLQVTATIHLPGCYRAELPAIKQMHAAQTLADE